MVACTDAQTDIVTTANVASVSITPPATTLSVGSQIPLQALVQDAAGKPVTGTDVFWSVRDPSIASVSTAGVVTGLALGSTEVAASSNGKSGLATITVQKTPVASVVVTPPHVDAAPSGRAQFTAVAYDAAQNPLTGRVITWTTSSATVAVVDTTGFMTAVGQGSATITATSEGKSGTATVTVTQAPVATVTVTPTPLSMSVGQTTQLTATLKDASGNTLNGRTVTWSSSSPGVATVSTAGLVTAVAAGSTTITATSEGKAGTAAVTISNVAVGSVTVQPQEPTIMQGTSVQLSATVRDVDGVVVTNRVVTWSSNNAAVATVTSAGVATGVSPGTATITATSEGKTGTTSVTVTPIPVGSVVVAGTADSVSTASTVQLTATVKDANGTIVTDRTITWVSTQAATATVSPSTGATISVSGKATGQTQIIATAETKSDTLAMHVLAAVTSVVVAPTAKVLSVLLGPTTQLTATCRDASNAVVNGRTIKWTSSNTAVATVDANGVVTAKAVGTAQITATAVYDGVVSAVPALVTVTP